VARMGENRNIYRLIVGNLKAKKQSGKPMRSRNLILIKMVKK